MTNHEVKTHEIDATDISLGRLASRIAVLLRGKNKVNFTPHLDQGDAVVVLNVDHLKITGSGNKKFYYSTSRHPGGLKKIAQKDLMEKKGKRELLRRAVFGMLPNNRLKNGLMKKLTIK